MDTDVDTVLAAFKTYKDSDDYQTDGTITVDKVVAAKANEVLLPALIEQKKNKKQSKGTGISTSETIEALNTLAKTGTYTDTPGDLRSMYQKLINALSARRSAVVTPNAPSGDDRWDGGRNISGKRIRMHTRSHRKRMGRRTRRRGGKMKMTLEEYDAEWNSGRALSGDVFWNLDGIKDVVSGKTNIKASDVRPGSALDVIRNAPQAAMDAKRKDDIKKAIEAKPGLGAVSVHFATLPLLLKKELDASYPQGESEYSITQKDYFSKEFFDRIEPAKEIDSELEKLSWNAKRNSYPELADVAQTLREKKTVSLVPRQVARLSKMIERIPGNAGFKEFGQASSVKSNVSPSAPKSTVRSIVPGADGTFSMSNPLARGKTAGRKLKKRSRKTRRH